MRVGTVIARQVMRAALRLAADSHCNTEKAPSQPSRGAVLLLFVNTPTTCQINGG
jgi:hypothetical protein